MPAPKKPPYLPISLDAKKKMPPCARAANVDVGVIAWGLMELWELVWATKNDVVDLTVIQGCFGHGPLVVPSLIAFEFIEMQGKKHRVKGAKTWLFGSETARKAGKASAATSRMDRGRRWHPKLTVYRLGLIIVTIALSSAKALCSPASVTLEWVIGIVFFLL